MKEYIDWLITVFIGLSSAWIATKKANTEHSNVIIDGFNELLTSYTEEIRRLSTAILEGKKQHEDELKEVQAHNDKKIAVLVDKIKLMDKQIKIQAKVIANQAKKIFQLENRGASNE